MMEGPGKFWGQDDKLRHQGVTVALTSEKRLDRTHTRIHHFEYQVTVAPMYVNKQ